MEKTTLRSRLRKVGRRLLVIGSTTAVVWGVALAIGLLVGAAWLDLLWELSPQARIAALVTAAGAGVVLLGVLAGLAARACGPAPVARRLDQTAVSGGQVLTGLELDRADASPSHRPELTAGLARLAVRRAAEVAAAVPVGRAVPANPLGRSLAGLLGVAAAVAVLVVLMPGLARTQWGRFVDPFGDVPPFTQLQFDVSPGNVPVVYGQPLEIDVTVRGGEVDELELVIVGRDGPEPLPMFPEPGGTWRAVLAKVTEPADYYVRTFRARSRRYSIEVITVPRLADVQFTIIPPEYTGDAPYTGPLPKGGIAGLPGTRVEVRASSNRPLSGGTITLSTGDAPKPQEIAMRPAAEDAQQAIGRFEVTADGQFELRVIDVAGQPSQESFSGTITLLADQRPFIRLLRPKTQSLATPNVPLPVAISAEDDYGISRVQLFRSLNDSRPLPMDVDISGRPRRRPIYEQLYLPLSEYGLEPGDVIKLFGRVEDNDPAGAKGSESKVVTARIISQEEFERLVQIREGIEVLLSKYAEARRRMEGLSKEIEGLQKKLDELPPDSPASEATREEVRRTVKRLMRESEALKKLAKHALPYDLDKNLGPQLESLAGLTGEMAEELAKLLEESDLQNERLKKQLEKLRQKLGAKRDEYRQQVTMPMELLAAIFPLMADQSRFVQLVLRQMDLAERLSTLKGRDGEDSPALKTRMRELEEEQREIRSQLDELLDDILNHLEQVPDEPEFDKLRETAAAFVRDVRASGAIEAMAEAEAGLAEFSGTIGYEKANRAAEILQKFLKRCQGSGSMGDMAGKCMLVFQPSLGGCLGNTIAQLLAQMGLSGSGGMGMGSGGGFSARRGAMGNMGLYGSMPGMFGAGEGDQGEGSGPGREPGGIGGSAGGLNPDEDSLIDDPAAGSAGGAGHLAVPPEYRRRVGEYFQRIADEVGWE